MPRSFSPKCVSCRQRTMVLSPVDYSAKVNHDGREYAVDIPSLIVPKCSNCGTVILDDEANERIDRAFRRQAHLLTPEQIREGRELLGLTQQALADRLGISVSTLSRWETGAQIQQRSLNRTMKAYFRSAAVRQCYAQIESAEGGEWVVFAAESQDTTVGVAVIGIGSTGPLLTSHLRNVTGMNMYSQAVAYAAIDLPPDLSGRSLVPHTSGGH